MPFFLCSCAIPKSEMDDSQYNFVAGMAGMAGMAGGIDVF